MTFTLKCFHCKNASSMAELGGLFGAKSWDCQKGFRVTVDGDICGSYKEKED